MARQRLRPWLIHTLDEGNVPGVEWIDRDQQIFKIPWKHGSKQDWTEHDSTIFLKWAIHTGKHREGIDEPNFAQCKTRLRCALNKAPDIKERKELENHDRPDPCKIYQFIDPNAEQLMKMAEQERAEVGGEEDMDVESPGQPVVPISVLDLCVKQESVSPLQAVTAENLPSDLAEMPSNDLVEGAGVNSTNLNQYLTVSTASFGSIGATVTGAGVTQQSANPNTEVTQYVVVQEVQGVPQVIASENSNGAVEVPVDATSVVVDGQYNMPAADVGLPLQATLFENSLQLQTSLHCLCHYRNLLSMDYNTTNKEGFRLYYGSIPQENVSQEIMESTYGPQNLEQVVLPDITPFMENQQQRMYTHQILEAFNRGIFFKIVDGDIYAKRLCKPSVFFKSNVTAGTVAKLERNTKDMTKVFDFRNEFTKDLRQFNDTKDSNDMPSAEIYLSVGQRPQKDEMSENLLIRVKIVYMFAKYLIEQAGGGDYRSICLSNPDPGDALAQILNTVHINDPASPHQ